MEKSWCINRSYVSTLQTVMANRSRSPLGLAKVGSSTAPEKATLGIYYAILLQGNCVFISEVASKSEPQRAAGLLPCLAINCENIIGPIISKRDERYIT